jgi:hypothetical protein
MGDIDIYQLPDHVLLLIKSAIKLVAIQAILELGLILEGIPTELQWSYLPGHNGPQPYSSHNQSPRLLNRQVKVAFFLVYQTLLLQVLTNFKHLKSSLESWSVSIFISLCLALLLERIEVASQKYLFFAKEVYKDEQGSIEDIEEYCREVDVVIFDRIYRVLSSKGKGRCSESRVMDRELLEALRGLQQQPGEFRVESSDLTNVLTYTQEPEGCQTPQADLLAQHPSRLVSALLDLVHQV